MTGINVNVNPNLLPGLLSIKDGSSELLRSVLNQVLEAEMANKLSATKPDNLCALYTSADKP